MYRTVFTSPTIKLGLGRKRKVSMMQPDKVQKDFRKEKIFHIRFYDYRTKQIIDERYKLCEAIIAYQNCKKSGLEVDLYMLINGIEYCLM